MDSDAKSAGILFRTVELNGDWILNIQATGKEQVRFCVPVTVIVVSQYAILWPCYNHTTALSVGGLFLECVYRYGALSVPRPWRLQVQTRCM